MRTIEAKSIVPGLVALALAISGLDASANEHCRPCQRCGQPACVHGISRDPGHPEKPKLEKPGDINRGECPPKRYQFDDCQRAGSPHSVAPWAKCSITDKYSAGFIGGGAAYAKLPQLQHALLSRGRPRKANGLYQHGEGTWGLDYGGFFGKANVWLAYTCGRNQGGEGAYATDGEPQFVSKLKSLVEHE